MGDHKKPVPIVGDIVAMTDVSINKKGGSLSATLKKGIRESLGEVGDRLTAAALEFAPGREVVLLSGGADADAPTSVRVSRISKNRYEVELETGEDEEIDDLTAAFLMLKVDQFKKRKLHLLPAVTADEWQAEMDEKFRAAETDPELTRSAG
jgi:hypothetical protein